jgi:hypothetical protein
MLEPEMLVALSFGAVLPYFSEAIWTWVKDRVKHQ